MTEEIIANLVLQLEARVGELEKGLNDADKKVSKFADNAKKVFAAIGVGVLINKFKNLTMNAITLADEMYKASQKTGILTDELSILRYQADLSDVSFQELSIGFKTLARNMLDISQDIGEAKDAFRLLGLDAIDPITGKLKSLTVITKEISDKFKEMEDGPTKAALAIKIFGRSGESMIPFLNTMTDVSDEAKSLSLVISERLGKNAESFRDNLTRMEYALQGIFLRISDQILPVLIDLSNAFLDFIKNNKQLSISLSILSKTIIIAGRSLYALIAVTNLAGKTLGAGFAALEQHIRGNLDAAEELRKAWEEDMWNALVKAGKALGAYSGKTEDLANALESVGDGTKKNIIIPTQDAEEAIDKLNSKIAELEIELLSINNPAIAANQALEKFISDTTKGFKTLPEDVIKKINELRTKFSELSMLKDIKLTQGILFKAENIKISEESKTALLELKSEFERGLYSIDEYYQKRIELAQKAYSLEIKLLQAEMEAESDANKKLELSTIIYQKQMEQERELKELQMERIDKVTEAQLKSFDEIEARQKEFVNDLASVITMAGELIQDIYATTGKESKTLFYIQKSIAIAEAWINAYASFVEGLKAKGTAGIALAYTKFGLAIAKIALMTATTIKGYKMGGLVKDDSIAQVHKNEYVIQAPAVKRFGLEFLESINNLLIPKKLAYAGANISSIPANNEVNQNFVINMEDPRLKASLESAVKNTVQKVLKGLS